MQVCLKDLRCLCVLWTTHLKVNLHVLLRKKKQSSRVFFFKYASSFATFRKVKSEHELVLLNFHRHKHFLKDHSIGKRVGVYFFFFLALVRPFPSQWKLTYCWTGVLKTIFHYTALSVCSWRTFMLNVHLHIYTHELIWPVSRLVVLCFNQNASAA